MTKAAYIPTSFVGDTIVNLAVCRAIVAEKGISRITYPMLPDIKRLSHHMTKDEDYDWLQTYVSKELTDALADPNPLVQERFKKGRMEAFYPYNYASIYQHRFLEINRFADYLAMIGVEVVYIATWTYGALVLADFCQKRYGMKIVGHELVGDEVRLVTDDRLIQEDSGLQYTGFVGHKWSKWFAGRKLRPSDFYIREPEIEEQDYILVMPSSRSKNQTTGHWDLDVQCLHWMGHNVKVGIWAGDLTPELYTSFVNLWAEGRRPDIIVLEDFEDTLKLVKGAKLVITNDSGQFHAAWIMGKKCVVKTKDYFQTSWIPSQRLRAKPIVVVPPMRVHPSDYIKMIKETVEWSLQA